MKLCTFLHNQIEYIGAYYHDRVVPLKAVQVKSSTMIDLINDYELNDILRLSNKLDNCKGYSLKEIRLISPIPNPINDFICLGVNYKKHLEESKRFHANELNFKPTEDDTIYFSKRCTNVIGHKGIINPHKNIVDSLDYEAELAIIIGKDCYNVKKENALDYVFGYSISNDVSARNIQTKHKQWYLGKSLDTFAVLGPYIVTKDEIKDYKNLNIKSYVNEELRQNSNTKYMIHDVESVIEELSAGMTIKAGSIILMGTPDGVGMGFNPPRFLNSGDVIKCEIENIGEIINKVGE